MEDHEATMTTFKHLLVPTDFGDAAARALDLAISLAAPSEARITLLHSSWIPPLAYAGLDAGGMYWPTDELAKAAKKELEAAVTLAKTKANYPRIEPVLVSGLPWERILSTAKERGADLIVMGTHGRHGLAHTFLGSVAEKVVRLSPIPVLTVGTPADRSQKEKTLAEAGFGKK
jgi:nucleotide-binding universal stress UspA family protein